MNRKTRFLFVLTGFFIFGVAAIGQGILRIHAAAQAKIPAGATSEDAQIVAVTFSSKWCGPCKILKPRLEAVKPAFASQPVRFIELNFTLGPKENFVELAQSEGFAQVYKDYHKATGYTVLVNRETGKQLDIITADYSKQAIKAAISRALALSS